MDNTNVLLTLLYSFIPLAQCVGLEMGEPFGIVAGSSVIDACFGSEDTLDEMHDLVEIPLEGSRDVFMHEKSHSLGCTNVLLNPLYHSHVLPMCSQPSRSPEYYINTPISNPMIFMLMLIWAMSTICLIYLVETLIILCP